MNRLSVIVVTKNEEFNIRACLESLKWVDELIVVDDMSTDRTAEIAKRYTKNIFLNETSGIFHRNRNLGIDRSTGDWLLSLDADEVISPELATEIREAINNLQKIGYYLPRKTHFLGQWIRGCGWWPGYTVRLFKRGVTSWPLGTHDTPVIKDKDKVGYLKNPINHYSYRDLRQYFKKFNFFTSRVAQEEYEKGVRVNKGNFLIYFLIRPLFSFFRKYFLWKGYREGFPGFFISFSSALVIFVTYAKLREKQQG